MESKRIVGALGRIHNGFKLQPEHCLADEYPKFKEHLEERIKYWVDCGDMQRANMFRTEMKRLDKTFAELKP